MTQADPFVPFDMCVILLLLFIIIRIFVFIIINPAFLVKGKNQSYWVYCTRGTLFDYVGSKLCLQTNTHAVMYIYKEKSRGNVL